MKSIQVKKIILFYMLSFFMLNIYANDLVSSRIYDLDNDGKPDVVALVDNQLSISLSSNMTNQPLQFLLPMNGDNVLPSLSEDLGPLNRIDIIYPFYASPGYFSLSVIYRKENNSMEFSRLASYNPCRTCTDKKVTYCNYDIGENKFILSNKETYIDDIIIDDECIYIDSNNKYTITEIYNGMKKNIILSNNIDNNFLRIIINKYKVGSKKNKIIYLKILDLLIEEKNYDASTYLLSEIEGRTGKLAEVCQEVKSVIQQESKKKGASIPWEDKKDWFLIDARKICHD